MSIWEYLARVKGWNIGHGAKPDAPEVTTEDMIAKRERYRNV
jgi:hypothetical protein